MVKNERLQHIIIYEYNRILQVILSKPPEISKKVYRKGLIAEIMA